MRGRSNALLGGVFRFGSIIGPYLGGLMASRVSMRAALLGQVRYRNNLSAGLVPAADCLVI
jgi:hypothetical protein